MLDRILRNGGVAEGSSRDLGAGRIEGERVVADGLAVMAEQATELAAVDLEDAQAVAVDPL